jgi:hypothetical protein
LYLPGIPFRITRPVQYNSRILVDLQVASYPNGWPQVAIAIYA